MAVLSILSLVLFAGLISLLLIVLTLMRETTILRGEVQALTSLITRPPEPTFLGKRIPELLARKLPATVDEPSENPIVAVLFLKQGCAGCHVLVEEVQMGLKHERFSRDRLWVVVEAFDDDDSIVRKSGSISDVVIHDSDGAIRQACRVLGTPTIFAIRSNTLQLVEHELGGDAAWISRQFSKHQSVRGLDHRTRRRLQSAVEASSVS